MAEESRMNLAALQQRDPYITEIIDRAVKVTLYKFSQERNQWAVTDIEGSLFVYMRSASPRYGLIILNRKDLNNLVQPLTSQVEFHLNTPFLLYKRLSDDREDSILGIWFVDRDECIRITGVLQGIVREMHQSPGVQQERSAMERLGLNQPPQVAAGGGGLAGTLAAGAPSAAAPRNNILSLLSNAQKTFNQERSGSEVDQPRPINKASGDAGGMSQISLDELFRTVNQRHAKAGLADSTTETPGARALYARSVSVSELEAGQKGAAMVAKATPPTAGPAEGRSDGRHPILQMISHKTVEELEKQHLEEHKRLKSGASTISQQVPGDKTGRTGKSPLAGTPGAPAEEAPVSGGVTGAGINLMHLLTGRSAGDSPAKSDQRSGGRSDVRGQQDVGVAAVKRLITMQDPQFGTNRSFIPVPSGAQQLADIEADRHADRTVATGPSTESPSHTPSSKESNQVLLTPSEFCSRLPSVSQATSSVNSLLTPQAFSDRLSQPPEPPSPAPPTDRRASPGQDLNPTPTPLTAEQLQQAMVHLIKNDASFLSSLHAAYLESFQAATGASSSTSGNHGNNSQPGNSSSGTKPWSGYL